jgi:hypothetical protein
MTLTEEQAAAGFALHGLWCAFLPLGCQLGNLMPSGRTEFSEVMVRSMAASAGDEQLSAEFTGAGMSGFVRSVMCVVDKCRRGDHPPQ